MYYPDFVLNQNVFKCLLKPPYAFSTLCIALTTFQSELALMLIKAVICPFFSLHSFSIKMGFDALRSSLLPFSWIALTSFSLKTGTDAVGISFFLFIMCCTDLILNQNGFRCLWKIYSAFLCIALTCRSFILPFLCIGLILFSTKMSFDAFRRYILPFLCIALCSCSNWIIIPWEALFVLTQNLFRSFKTLKARFCHIFCITLTLFSIKVVLSACESCILPLICFALTSPWIKMASMSTEALCCHLDALQWSCSWSELALIVLKFLFKRKDSSSVFKPKSYRIIIWKSSKMSITMFLTDLGFFTFKASSCNSCISLWKLLSLDNYNNCRPTSLCSMYCLFMTTVTQSNHQNAVHNCLLSCVHFCTDNYGSIV